MTCVQEIKKSLKKSLKITKNKIKPKFFFPLRQYIYWLIDLNYMVIFNYIFILLNLTNK